MPAAIPLLAAGVGAAATVYGASQAAGAARDAASQNNALARWMYEQNQGNLNPFMQQGYAVNPLILGALGVEGGNSAGAAKAFDAFKGSTGYTTNLAAGVDAIGTNKALAGLLNSGATLKGVTDYGQKLNSNYFTQWLSGMVGQQGVGLNAANALAGYGQNYVNTVSGNNNSAARATGNAWLPGTNGVNSLLAAFMQSRGQSPYGSSYGSSSGGGGGGG